jgi:hypothetical protein
VRVHRSALKHGVTAKDALYAAEHYLYVADLDDENPIREFRLGFDTAGRLLELVVVRFDSGNELLRNSQDLWIGASHAAC